MDAISPEHRAGVLPRVASRARRVAARARRRRLSALAVAAAALAALSPGAASAQGRTSAAKTLVTGGRLHLRKPALAAASPATTPRWACPEGACQAIVVGQRVKVAQGSGERRGLDPQDLQSAYNIPFDAGLAADDRPDRRVRLPGRGSGPRKISRTLRPAALHKEKRLLQEGQPERRRSQLPARRSRLGRGGGAR